MSSAVAVHFLTPADLESRLAALGIPIARLIAAAHIARSTWSAWRAGRTRPRPDRWSAATEAFAALVAEAEAARPPAPAEPPRAAVVPLAGSSAPTGAPPRFVPLATAAPADRPDSGPLLPRDEMMAIVAHYHAAGKAQSGDEPEEHPVRLAYDEAWDDVQALTDGLAEQPAATLDALGTKAAVFAAILGPRAMGAEDAVAFVSEVSAHPRLARSIIVDAARLCAPGPGALGDGRSPALGFNSGAGHGRPGLVADAEAARSSSPAEPAGAEIVPLTGSSPSTGAPPRFVPLATAAPAAVDPDAALIDFAGRVTRLVSREDRLVLKCAQIEEAAHKALPPMPTCKRMETQPVVNERWRADGSRGSLFDPPDWGKRALAADQEHRAALADWDRQEQDVQERLDLPQWMKLRRRATRRLERWGLRLTLMAPLTLAGLAAKAAAASAAAEGDELPDDWRQALAVSLSRDAVRLCGGGGAAGAPPRFVPLPTAAPAADLVAECGRVRTIVDRNRALWAAAMPDDDDENHPGWEAVAASDVALGEATAALTARPARDPRELAAKASVVLAGLGDNPSGWEGEIGNYVDLVQSTMADAVRLGEPRPATSDIEAVADRVAALARREWAAAGRDCDAEDRAENDPTPRHLSAARAARRLMRRLSRRLRRDSVALAALPASGPAAVAAKARAVLAIGAATDDDPWWAALRDSVVREAAALGPVPIAAQAAMSLDPFAHYHREIIAIQAAIDVTPEDTVEEAALWKQWREIERRTRASCPTTPAGAVGALEYARRELHQFRIENQEVPRPTELLILHLIDGALGVLRTDVGLHGGTCAAAGIARLRAEWLDAAAWDTRLFHALVDLAPDAPDYKALSREAERRAACHVAVLRRLADERRPGLDGLALKAAAVVAACGENGLDFYIADENATNLAEIELAVALSLARDVVEMIGDPARDLAEAVLHPVELPTLGETAAVASVLARPEAADGAALAAKGETTSPADALVKLARDAGSAPAILLGWAQTLAAVQREGDALAEAELALEARLPPPTVPEALFVRADDPVLLRIGARFAHQGRPWYGASATIALLGELQLDGRADPDGSAHRRREEILAVEAAWCAEWKRAKVSLGLDAAEAASEAQGAVFRLARDGLMDAPVTSFADVMAKVLVLSDFVADRGQSASAELAQRRAELLEGGVVDQYLAMSLAVLRDLAAMAEIRGLTLAGLAPPVAAEASIAGKAAAASAVRAAA